MHKKVLYTGDWHADRKLDKFLDSYAQLKDYVYFNEVDLLIIPGDITDGRIEVGPVFNVILQCITELANLVPIHIIYGTPSHDTLDSLDCFSKLDTKYPIKIVKKIEKTYTIFNADKKFIQSYLPEEKDHPAQYVNKGELVIFSCPYPIRSRLLTPEELKLPYKEQNEMFSSRLQEWCKWVKAETKKFNDLGVVTLLSAHLQLEGSMPSFNQDMQAEFQKVEWFDGICNWGCLGHIHNSHKVGKNLQYTGSFYNKTWGETEDKFFYLLEIDGLNVKNVAVELTTPKLKKEIFENVQIYEEFKTKFFETQYNGGLWDLWLVVKAGDKGQVNILREEEYWKFKGINEIRLEVETLKLEGIARNENYSTSMTISQKFKAWCKSKKIKPTEFQIEKIKEVSHENI